MSSLPKLPICLSGDLGLLDSYRNHLNAASIATDPALCRRFALPALYHNGSFQQSRRRNETLARGLNANIESMLLWFIQQNSNQC